MKNVYLQLYSLGQEASESMEENFRVVSEMGYAGVEFAGSNYGGLSVEEMKAALAKYNLKTRSAHMQYAAVERDLQYLHDIGVEYAIIAMHPIADHKAALEFAGQLNELGAKAAKLGMKVGYHNHTQEFNEDEGETFLETLLKNTDPETVIFELDCGWAAAAKGKENVINVLTENAGRFKAIHIKENNKVIGPEPPFTPAMFAARPSQKPAGELTEEDKKRIDEMQKKRLERESWNCPTGQGLLDWNEVKQLCNKTGIDLFVVEREASYGGKKRLECLAEDVKYLTENVKD